MLVSKFSGSRIAGGLLAGLFLALTGGSALAQYSGERICGYCHEEQYQSYKNHGHPWADMPTDRQAPVDGKFPGWEAPYASGALVADAIRDVDLYSSDGTSVVRKLQWSDVVSMMCGFGDGDGYYLIDPLDMPWLSGRYVGHSTSQLTVKPTSGKFPFRCFNCHNTGGKNLVGHPYGVQGLDYSAALPGIQCEQCHGPSSMVIPPKELCVNCHSRTDAADKSIPADLTNMWYNDRHCQGDETRASPHKNIGCVACHDPHKSTALGEGGLKYAESFEEYGNQCKHCHNNVQLRGGHGEIGVECADCHMPRLSEMGSLITHLFRISSDPITLADNVDPVVSGTTTTYYLKKDANGESVLTLDLVCTQCHDNMSIEQMSKKAKAIHREPNLVDLTVNGFDSLRVVKTTQKVAVAFSVECGDEKGKKATWSVLCQGPRGWTYWNGKSWLRGNKPWRKGVAINDIAKQTVLNGKITAKGYYTYWVSIAAADGEYHDSVPVLVR